MKSSPNIASVSNSLLEFARKTDSTTHIWVGIIFASALLGALHILSYGNLVVPIAVVGVLTLIGFSILRPAISLYALVFLGLGIEQTHSDTETYAWTNSLQYHQNVSNIFPFLKVLAVNPMELHFLCIIAGVLLRFLIVKEKSARVLASKELLLYFGSIGFFMLYGFIRGGEPLPALWEVRGIIYLILMMIVVPQIIRTTEQMNYVVWAFVAGLAFRSIETASHYIGSNFSVGSHEGWGNHEDAGMIVSLLVFIVALYVFKVREQRIKPFLTLFVLPFLLAIIGSDRRTAYPVLVACLIVFAAMQPKDMQRKVLNFSWKAGIVFLLYLAVFWHSNSDNIFVMPAKNIRMGFAGDNEVEAGDAYTSNLFRKAENYDLSLMIRSRPLLGTGFGVPIDYMMPIPIMFDLGFYITHNMILGLLAKTGIVGFIIFMIFYLSILREIARGVGITVNNQYHRAILVLAGAAIVNHLVFSFFDITLMYYRTNIYLGALLGISSSILSLAEEGADSPGTPSRQTKAEETATQRLLLREPDNAVTHFTR